VADNVVSIQKILEDSHRSLGKGHYLIESIIDRRVMQDGSREYLVKWLGYLEPTWTKVSNFDDPKTPKAADAAYDAGKFPYLIFDTTKGTW
jgi:hypothetical protein